jgi:hypothetical protein
MRALKFRELDQELQRVRLLHIEIIGAHGAAPDAAATLRRDEPRYEVPDHDTAEVADSVAAAKTREPPAAARRDMLQEMLTFPNPLPPWTSARERLAAVQRERYRNARLARRSTSCYFTGTSRRTQGPP